MKGALACYVEAVRSLIEDGVRLQGDVIVAAVAGEIEKTQQGDAQGAEYRGYAAGSRYLVGHGGAADMCILGEPTENKLVLAHFGTLWLRLSTHGPFIHTAFSSGRLEENSIVRMRPVLDRVLEWLPTLGGGDELRRRSRRRERRRDPGRLRLARVADAARDRPVPRPARAAGRADGGGAAARRSSSRAALDGVEAEVYVTAPGAEIEEAHPLVGAVDEAHEEVFGARAGARRHALVLGRVRADAATGSRRVNYGTSSGLPDAELGENLEIDGLVKTADGLRARDAHEGLRMKLVTYDGGKVGRIDGEEIVRLDVPDMRDVLRARRRRGRPASGRRSPTRASRAPIVPKKFFHTAGNFREHEEESKRVGWSHEIAPWIVFFQNVDAIVGPDDPVVYPEHLTEELDYELELAVVISQARQVVRARGGDGLHRRLRDLQRHHRPRHPAARDGVGRLLVLQGDRHVLPARALDRDARRDPRPARPRDGAARQRRGAADVALGPHVRDDPGDPVPLLAARLLARATSSRPGRSAAWRASARTRRRST